MKQKLIIIAQLIVLPALANAQLGKKILNRVKTTAETRVINKSVSEIEKALDKIEGVEQTGKQKPERKSVPAHTPDKNVQPAADQKAVEDTAAGSSLKLYSKYDFVPGEKIIYTNDFAQDAIGELPVGWNSNGTGAVVTLNGLPGNWAQLNQSAVYLTDNKEALTENFTVEFDMVLRRTNPKAPFPAMMFGVLASGDYEPGANELLKAYTNTYAAQLKIQPYDNNGSHLQLLSFYGNKKYLNTDIKKMGELQQYFNKILHVAMQVQKKRLRIWFNETKLYDLPKAIAAGVTINQLYFDVQRYGGPESEVGYAIGNIKIAKGLPDTRHKLIEEGKFSTTGIVFAVNAAVIKPESNGVLKEIADLLKQFPEIKINIIGHTDSDGRDEANRELSRKRAAAVKQALVNDFSIDAARIQTEGKGETEPAGDNKTKEGKAQNRRVEFVKQ